METKKRTPEEERRIDLDGRLNSLLLNNVYYRRAFGWRSKKIKGDSFIISEGDEIAAWDRDNLDDFEEKVLKLEAAKKEKDEEDAKNKPLEDRRKEYLKIDGLLMEALAEKEENNAEKMTEYLAKRKAIKEKFPK